MPLEEGGMPLVARAHNTCVNNCIIKYNQNCHTYKKLQS